MKLKSIIGLFLISLLLPSIMAVDTAQLVEEAKTELVGQRVSGPLGTLFGNEQINIYVDDVLTIGVTTEDKQVKSIELQEVDDPSLKVYVTEDVLQKVEAADDPTASLRQALAEGLIRYEAVGFFNKIKFAVLNLFIDVALEGDSIEAVPNVTEPEKEVSQAPSPTSVQQAVPAEGNQNVKEMVVADEVPLDTDSEILLETPLETTHVVELTSNGFSPETLEVNAGDTVEWKNIRSGAVTGAMVIGVRNCGKVRSGLLKPGASFSWTFDESGICTIVDGVLTTKESKVLVN